MSKVTRVVVLCPNGRRQTVNLTPNSSILQILEEVCQIQKINPNDFDICHYKKPLDLSLPIRFANIANNAQLELQPAKSARRDCLVTVGLQLESGERIMKDFVPSTSVWDVMEQCLNIKTDKINFEKKGEPICIYMRQKLIGDAIKNTTLRGLGLTEGSAVIRLMYRNPEDLSDQAHVSTPLLKAKDISPNFSDSKLCSSSNEMECDPPIDELKTYSKIGNVCQSTNVPNMNPKIYDSAQIFTSVDNNQEVKSCKMKIEGKITEENSNRSISVLKKEVGNDKVVSNTSEKVCQLTVDQKTEMDSTSMDQDPTNDEIGAIHYIGGRHAVVYSLNDITDVKKADLPDEFFELTIDDAKYLMEEFKKSRKEIENQPLLTKELRNRQILKKLGRFKKTVIRVYFPERLVLQAVFEAQETVQDICDFIRNYLEDQSLTFYLYTSPPKEKKDPAKTLIEAMLIPAAVVYFGSNTHNESYLMSNIKEKISDPRAASLAAFESRKQAISEAEEDISSELEVPPITFKEPVVEDKVPGPSSSQQSSCIQTTEKVPKWLKLSRK